MCRGLSTIRDLPKAKKVSKISKIKWDWEKKNWKRKKNSYFFCLLDLEEFVLRNKVLGIGRAESTSSARMLKIKIAAGGCKQRAKCADFLCILCN